MEISRLSRKILALCVTAALSSGATYWYCSSEYDTVIQQKDDEISELKEAVNNANVTKRVSEQMEEIANQSKTIADTARQKAVFESQKALEQAERAERERHNALIAKDQADRAEAEAKEQAIQANHERELAQQARDIADYQRAKADTLRFISLAQSLSQKSITQYNTGAYDLSGLLAYSGYIFNKEYAGNSFQQDVFTALLANAEKARSYIAHFSGSVNAIQCVAGNNLSNETDHNVVVLTDYGEIGLMTPQFAQGKMSERFNTRKIMADSAFFFKDLYVKDSTAYALDVEGRLVVINIYGHSTPKVFDVASPTRDAERWLKLLNIGKDLIAVGEHQISWVSPKDGKVYRQRYVENTICEAGISNGKLMVFTKQNDFIVFRNGEPEAGKITLWDKNYVTCYYYDKGKNLHLVGINDGTIYLFRNEEYIKKGLAENTLTGHTGPITHMDSFGWRFVSSAYDKTLRFWSLEDIDGIIAPVTIECSDWPLSFDIDENAKALRVGYSYGTVESICFSLENNAESVHRNLKREFDDKEWMLYIGKDVPYRKFKEK